MKQWTEEQKIQIERLEIAGITLEGDDLINYLNGPDDLGEFREDMEIPLGYKKCGGCKRVLKFYLFNKNNGSKNKCTGNCKACQKASAAKSYERTKHKRDYKKYYAENKERKQEHSKRYYEEHKEEIRSKQKEYHSSKQGKKVMKRAHKKRRKLLAANKGVPYQREWVIDRDKMGGEHPICYICKEPIKFERDIQIDHLVPVVLGGKDCFTNVGCTHTLCNLRRPKDARDLAISVIEEIMERAERYIDEHPELFGE